MLHPCIGYDDEKSWKPGAGKNKKCCPPMAHGAEAFFTKKKQSKKSRFQEKRKYAFHYQWRANHASCDAGKLCPVCAELEFHWDSSDHTENKIDAKDFCPETRRLIINFIFRPQCHCLQHHNQQRQSHGELGKQVVECCCESKMKPVSQKSAIHSSSPATIILGPRRVCGNRFHI